MQPKNLFSSSILKLSLFYLAGFAQANIIFDPIHNTCGAVGTQLLNDVTQLAHYAHDQLLKMQQGSLTGWDHYRTVLLFDTFFDGRSADAQSRFDAVVANLNTMGNAASASSNVHVACDDSNIWTRVPANPQTNTPETLTFNNPNDGQPYSGLPSDIVLTCDNPRTVNGQPRFQIGYRWGFQGVEYIFLCTRQYTFPGLLQHLSPNIKSGSDLEAQQSWSTTLFHELSHALIPSMRGDTAGGIAPGGERYGWSGTQEVRTTYATENPDSLSYLALGLALDPWLWNTGKAVATADEYTRLAAEQPPSAAIQTFGLTR